MPNTNSPFETRLIALETQLERLDDARQVSNVMGYYAYLTVSHRFRELAEHFALEEPDVSIDIDNMAKWVGAESVRSLLYSQDVDPIPAPELPLDLAPVPGQMHEHALTTPVIEIADDGHTGRGLWISPGHETVAGQAYWAWCKYAVDFRKVRGTWKIWHLKVHGTFFTPYDKDWVATAQDAPQATAWSDQSGAEATAPWQYNGTDLPPALAIPKRYRTWDSRH